MKTKKLIVLGFGSVVCSGGKVMTQSMMLDYFRDVSESYDEAHFYVIELDRAVAYESLFVVPGARIATYKSTWRGILSKYLNLIFEVRGADIILFLPASSRWCFIYPVIFKLASRTAVYLADYPEFFANKLRLSSIPFAKGFYTWGYEYALKSASIVIARGKGLEAFGRRYNVNTAITRPMTSFQYGQNGSSPSEKKSKTESAQLLFIGRVTEKKGIDVLLSALALIREQQPSFKFHCTIAGDGHARESLIELAEELGLVDNVSFTGWIDSSHDKAQLWNSVDVHIVPSTFSEGVPRSVDEAVYYGVPTIASRVGGLEFEFDGGEVVLIDPNDEAMLASAILKLATDSEFRNKIIDSLTDRLEWLQSSETAGKQHCRLLQLDEYYSK